MACRRRNQVLMLARGYDPRKLLEAVRGKGIKSIGFYLR